MSYRDEPVGHTCPDIDKLLKKVKDIEGFARSIQKLGSEDIDEIMSLAGDIEWEISDFYDVLEDLRNSNHKLRNWGEENAGEIDRLLDEIKLLEKEKR